MSAAGPFLRPSHPRRRRRRSAVVRALARLTRLAGALAVPAAVWLWVSDHRTFALSAVETDGSPRIPPQWIERALEPELGSNLLSLPLERVRRRLEANPWLGRVEARKELPSVLRVEVEERQAVAVVETAEGLWFVDADGQRIARLGAGESPGSLLRVAAGATAIGISPALAAAEASSVRRALAIEHTIESTQGPSWRLPVLWAEVIGDDDFRLYLGEVPFPILVRSRDIAPRLVLLERLRPAILDRVGAVAEADLRFEGRVIVRRGELEPAAATAATAVESGDGEAATAPAAPAPLKVWDPQPKET